jgi:hypothetical protein
MINEYLILRELGRGVHGKVKLAEDMEKGCLVVSIHYGLDGHSGTIPIFAHCLFELILGNQSC